MNSESFVESALRRHLPTAAQIGFFILAWLLADFLARRLGGRIPGSALGLFGVLGLLGCGLLRPSQVQSGARLLLAEMLLFFVPAFVGLMNYSRLLAAEGFRLLSAVVLGTVAVMAGTAWIADRVFLWERRGQSSETHEP